MVERVLVVDQRILRGEQADIRVCDVQQLHDRFRPVHAEPPALDDPFLAHPRESGKGALAGNLELLLPRRVQIGIVGREVVHEDDIERVNAKPLQAVLDRALHAIRRVVEDQVIRRRREGKILLGVVLPRRLEQLPHLGREDIVATVLGVEEIAEPALAQAEAIPGRGVVIADTRAPRRVECGIGVLLRDNRELIAKRYAAQTEADRGLVVFRPSCLHAGLPLSRRGGGNAGQRSCCRDCRALNGQALDHPEFPTGRRRPQRMKAGFYMWYKPPATPGHNVRGVFFDGIYGIGFTLRPPLEIGLLSRAYGELRPRSAPVDRLGLPARTPIIAAAQPSLGMKVDHAAVDWGHGRCAPGAEIAAWPRRLADFPHGLVRRRLCGRSRSVTSIHLICAWRSMSAWGSMLLKKLPTRSARLPFGLLGGGFFLFSWGLALAKHLFAGVRPLTRSD